MVSTAASNGLDDNNLVCLTTEAMYKSDVLSHFNDNQAEAARALGITRQAVDFWGDIVPETSAYKLQVITRGALKVNPALYVRSAKARKAVA